MRATNVGKSAIQRDIAIGLLMNATQITDKTVVNEDIKIIVTVELEDLALICLLMTFSIPVFDDESGEKRQRNK